MAARRNARHFAQLCVHLSVHGAHDVRAERAGKRMDNQPSAGVQRICGDHDLDSGPVCVVSAGSPATEVVSQGHHHTRCLYSVRLLCCTYVDLFFVSRNYMIIARAAILYYLMYAMYIYSCARYSFRTFKNNFLYTLKHGTLSKLCVAKSDRAPYFIYVNYF